MPMPHLNHWRCSWSPRFSGCSPISLKQGKEAWVLCSKSHLKKSGYGLVWFRKFTLYLRLSSHLTQSQCPHRDQSTTFLLSGQIGFHPDTEAGLRKVSEKNVVTHKCFVTRTLKGFYHRPLHQLVFNPMSSIGLKSSRPLLLLLLNKTSRNLISNLSSQVFLFQGIPTFHFCGPPLKFYYQCCNNTGFWKITSLPGKKLD